MKCSKINCSRETTPPFRTCEGCRFNNRASAQRYKDRHPEKARAQGRESQARRRAAKTPVVLAYLERSRATNRVSSRAWVARNPERKALTRKLNHLIEKGEISKPLACQDCKREVRPVVAWGLDEDDDGAIVVGAWTCWTCWHKRRRAAQKTIS